MTAMATDDPYDLQRFVTAQEAGGTYQQALAELRAGRKASHWMWFVFPQIAGLGYSPTARTYAITSLAEARAYLAHPVLGARLTECAEVLAGLHGRTAEQVFGEIDAMKLCSSMTLFLHADPGKPGQFGARRGRGRSGGRPEQAGLDEAVTRRRGAVERPDLSRGQPGDRPRQRRGPGSQRGIRPAPWHRHVRAERAGVQPLAQLTGRGGVRRVHPGHQRGKRVRIPGRRRVERGRDTGEGRISDAQCHQHV